MTAIAGTPPGFTSRSRLQLAAALVAGIGIGSVAGVALTQGGPAESGAGTGAAAVPPAARVPTAGAGQEATTSASEQYRGWYTQSRPHTVTTSAGDQYRGWYTQPGAHQVTTSAGEQYRFWYSGEE